jgi:hypothetical protein
MLTLILLRKLLRGKDIWQFTSLFGSSIATCQKDILQSTSIVILNCSLDSLNAALSTKSLKRAWRWKRHFRILLKVHLFMSTTTTLCRMYLAHSLMSNISGVLLRRRHSTTIHFNCHHLSSSMDLFFVFERHLV